MNLVSEYSVGMVYPNRTIESRMLGIAAVLQDGYEYICRCRDQFSGIRVNDRRFFSYVSFLEVVVMVPPFLGAYCDRNYPDIIPCRPL